PDVHSRDRIIHFGLREYSVGLGHVDDRGQTTPVAGSVLTLGRAGGGQFGRSVSSDLPRSIQNGARTVDLLLNRDCHLVVAGLRPSFLGRLSINVSPNLEEPLDG